MSGLQIEPDAQRKTQAESQYQRRCEASRKRRKVYRPLNPDAISYNVQDAGEMLGGRCDNTIREWVAKGWLRGVKVGRILLIEGNSLRELVRNGPPVPVNTEAATEDAICQT